MGALNCIDGGRCLSLPARVLVCLIPDTGAATHSFQPDGRLCAGARERPAMASAPPWHCLSHATWAACVAHHCLPFSLPPFFCPSSRPTFPVWQRADVRRRPHLAGPCSPSPPTPLPPCCGARRWWFGLDPKRVAGARHLGVARGVVRGPRLAAGAGPVGKEKGAEVVAVGSWTA